MPDDRMRGFLEISEALHNHLCPRQVLGVRIGMYAAELLELDLPQKDKRLLIMVEADGCFADGVSAATGCWFGRRTMRLVDFGKVAATFIDTQTGASVRIHPSVESRSLAAEYAPDQESRWHAYLVGYQRMPVSKLLRAERVQLRESIEAIVSKPGQRAICSVCHEEILNDREVIVEGNVLCKGCAGEGYYMVMPSKNHEDD